MELQVKKQKLKSLTFAAFLILTSFLITFESCNKNQDVIRNEKSATSEIEKAKEWYAS